MKKILLNSLIISTLCFNLFAQKAIQTTETFVPDYALNRFEKEIRAYEKQDSLQGITKGKILFFGSSSFRFWKNIQQDLAPLPIINRGFGGSTIPELIYYTDRMVFPYEPKKLVIYGGENDLNGGKEKSAEQVFDSYKTFVSGVRKHLPKTKIYFVSMKLSPSRRKNWDKVNEGNARIKAFSKRSKRLFFIDINPLLFNANGTVKSELYTKDSLHLNQKGYDEYAKLMKPILAK